MENYKKNNRISEALSIRGLKQVDLVEMTGLKKSSISSWIAQSWQPKADALGTMAKALDVSEMWLAGYECPMERPAKQKLHDEISALSEILEDNERLANLMLAIKSLTDTQLDSVENLVSEFAKLNTPQ